MAESKWRARGPYSVAGHQEGFSAATLEEEEDWDLDEVDPESTGKHVPSPTTQKLLRDQELPGILHLDTSLPSSMILECQDCQEPLLPPGPGVFFCPPCLGLQLDQTSSRSSTTGSGDKSNSTATCREPEEETHSAGQFLPGYTSSSVTVEEVCNGQGSVKKGIHATGREDTNVSRVCLFCRCRIEDGGVRLFCDKNCKLDWLRPDVSKEDAEKLDRVLDIALNNVLDTVRGKSREKKIEVKLQKEAIKEIGTEQMSVRVINTANEVLNQSVMISEEEVETSEDSVFLFPEEPNMMLKHPSEKFSAQPEEKRKRVSVKVDAKSECSESSKIIESKNISKNCETEPAEKKIEPQEKFTAQNDQASETEELNNNNLKGGQTGYLTSVSRTHQKRARQCAQSSICLQCGGRGATVKPIPGLGALCTSCLSSQQSSYTARCSPEGRPAEKSRSKQGSMQSKSSAERTPICKDPTKGVTDDQSVKLKERKPGTRVISALKKVRVNPPANSVTLVSKYISKSTARTISRKSVKMNEKHVSKPNLQQEEEMLFSKALKFWKCNKCTFKSKLKSVLKAHASNPHFKCPFCSHESPTKNALRMHKHWKHSGMEYGTNTVASESSMLTEGVAACEKQEVLGRKRKKSVGISKDTGIKQLKYEKKTLLNKCTVNIKNVSSSSQSKTREHLGNDPKESIFELVSASHICPSSLVAGRGELLLPGRLVTEYHKDVGSVFRATFALRKVLDQGGNTVATKYLEAVGEMVTCKQDEEISEEGLECDECGDVVPGGHLDLHKKFYHWQAAVSLASGN